MTYAHFEESADLGEPINLYLFRYGPGTNDVYRYCDAETDQTVGGAVWVAVPIARSDISSSGTTDKSSFEIEMDRRGPVPELFRVYPPSWTVTVTVWQGHAEDPNKDYKVIFSGIVLSCSREQGLLATLSCEPASVSMQRIGLRRNWQYMCPHVLYGPQCKANKAAATAYTAAFLVQGRFLTVTSNLGNQYLNGMLEWENENGQTEIRTILAISVVEGRSRFTLSGIAPTVTVGQTVRAVKGCGHVLSDCGSVHNNIPNFGGQPYIPLKNPLGRANPFQ